MIAEWILKQERDRYIRRDRERQRDRDREERQRVGL